jgi:hypothetical protein
MSQERSIALPPAMEKAVNELKGRISERFPQASFVVEEGFDPQGNLPRDYSGYRRYRRGH